MSRDDIIYDRLRQMVQDFGLLAKRDVTDEEASIMGRHLYEQIEGFANHLADMRRRDDLDRSVREAEAALRMNRHKATDPNLCDGCDAPLGHNWHEVPSEDESRYCDTCFVRISY